MKLFHLQDLYQAFSNRRRKRHAEPQDVLLISSGGLGDTVLFAYVVENFIALARSNERIILLCNRGSEKMGFLFPPAVEILSIDFQQLRKSLSYRKSTMASLFNANFRLVIHTDYLRHPDMDEALAKACAATETVAMKPRYLAKYSGRMIANAQIYDRLFDSGPVKKDKILRWLDFAAWLSNATPQLQTLELPKDRIPPPIPAKTPLVIVHPYSAIKQKQFSPHIYEEIFKCIPDSHEIAITGTALDRKRNPEFETLIKMPRVHFEDADFQLLASIIQAAELVISVDTACMHLAVAVGAPTLCLASAAFVGEIVPYDIAWSPPHVEFVYKSMDCEGCLGNCHLPSENGMYPCVAQLSKDSIIEQVRKRLRSISL